MMLILPGTVRRCSECGAELAGRVDAQTCGLRCRVARHRRLARITQGGSVMALTTKTHDALAAQKFAPGDRAYVGEVIFGDEDEPARDSHTVGTFKSEAAAKRAVAAEVRRLEAAEDRKGWWTGSVEPGTILDRSGHWDGYGYVEDWDWERDYTADSTWYAAGKWQR